MCIGAVIDIGSNTLRLLIAKTNPTSLPKQLETVFYTHRITRLGEGLHRSGILSKAGMERGLNALHEFSNILNQYGIQNTQVYVVATAAVREAKNGSEFCHQAMRKCGLNIHVIKGEDEAMLSLQGVNSVLAPETGKGMLLFDIGGGSTEFVRSKNGQIMDAISRKLGVVRLVEAHLRSDPPSASDYNAMLTSVAQHLDAVTSSWGDHDTPPIHLVGTAGTVTTIAAIHLNLTPYDANTINNHQITTQSFFSLRDQLLAMPHAKRQAMQTIEEGRADLIIAGLAILESIINRWNYQHFTTVDSGLLAGAWQFRFGDKN